MKKIWIPLLSVLLVFLFMITAFFWYSQGRQEDTNQLKENGLECLKEGKNLEAYRIFSHLPETEKHREDVQYALFLSTYELKAYTEAFEHFQHLSETLQAKQKPQVWVQFISFLHQKKDEAQAQALLDQAIRIYGSLPDWEDLKAGKYANVLEEKIPEEGKTLQSQEAQNQEAFNAYQKQDYEHAVWLWAQRAESERIDWEEWKNYAEATLHLENPAAYHKMLDQMVHQSYSEEERASLPQYYGNSFSNFLNGGEAVQIENQIYFPKFVTYQLSTWPLEVFQRSENEFAKGTPQAQPVLQRAVSYLNVRGKDLYYADPNNQFHVYRYDTEKKEEQDLGLEQADQLFLAGPKLYYRSLADKMIHSFHLEHHEDKLEVNSPVQLYAVHPQGIVYIDQGQKKHIFLHTYSGETKEIVHHASQFFVIRGDNLIDINIDEGQNLWITSLSNPEQTRLLLDVKDCNQLYWEDSGILYFNSWTLQKLDPHTGAVAQVAPYGGEHITEVAGHLLFSNQNLDFYKMICFPDTQHVYQIDP